MIASVGVCISVRMGFASSTACVMDALSVGVRSDPSQWLQAGEKLAVGVAVGSQGSGQGSRA